MGLEVQARAANRPESVDRSREQATPYALSLVSLCHGHLGQFENAAAMMLQGNRSNEIARPAGHQYEAAVRNDFGFRVRQHAFVDGFDDEVPFEPLHVQAAKRGCMFGSKVDDFDLDGFSSSRHCLVAIRGTRRTQRIFAGPDPWTTSLRRVHVRNFH